MQFLHLTTGTYALPDLSRKKSAASYDLWGMGPKNPTWLWVKTNGTILVGAPPILLGVLVGIGMFTGGEPGFGPIAK